MKRILCVIIVLCSALFLYGKEKSVHILCYHTFQGSGGAYDIAPGELEKQLVSLKKLGYHFISYRDFSSGNLQHDNNILVTVDDGKKSLLSVDNEVFEKLGIEPVLFIYPNIIQKKSYALTWKELDAFVRKGYEIGAHGFYHLHINKKLLQKDEKGFLREIAGAKKRLEKKLGITVKAMSYPFGTFDKTAVETVEQAGYENAFTLKQKPLIVKKSGPIRSYDAPRYMVTEKSWKYIYPILKRWITKRR